MPTVSPQAHGRAQDRVRGRPQNRLAPPAALALQKSGLEAADHATLK